MKKKYLISGAIVLIIILIVYFVKNIFPFGNNHISWGDLHSQVLTLYYNFYDVVRNGKSFLISYSGGIATSMLPNFVYYISSPFTLIVLLFKRSNIPQALSLIVLFKFILSAITCNYFLDKHFKKVTNFYKVFFSVAYALSTYSLSLYIITGWIDIVYMFPLLVEGLYQLLKNKKVKMYIIFLSLSFIFNFYITFLTLIFIFFISLLYLLMFDKKEIKVKTTILGVSTILSLSIASFAIIPTILQIFSSTRMGLDLNQIYNSRTGPLVDKIMFLTSISPMAVCNLLLLKNFKHNKKISVFYISTLFLVAIPLIVEPINKMLHLGSYVCYPYRYGFIMIFILIMGACMYLENSKQSKKDINIIPILTTIIFNTLICFITYKYRFDLQLTISELTFGGSYKPFTIMCIIFILNFLSYFSIFKFCKKDSKVMYICLEICLIVFVLSQSMLYILKTESVNEIYHENYSVMNDIKEIELDNNYHIKSDAYIFIENYGFVIDYPTQDFWTSLIDDNMFINYQKLGYNSYWMNTTSTGSNVFMDGLLSNKYYLTKNNLSNDLYNKNSDVDDLKLYEMKFPISTAYIIDKNASLKEIDNSFDATNLIYSCFKDDNIFDIYSDFNMVNAKYEDNNISIVDENKEAYLEKKLHIDSKKILYFEISGTYISMEKYKIYSLFDIYVDDKLIVENYPNRFYNNSVELGIFEDTDVNIKLVLKKSANNINGIRIGLLDYNKLLSFFDRETNINIAYNKDININYDSDEEKILFIPTPYIKGMSAKNNGKKVEIVNIFDSFIGIKLDKGKNNISIKYITPGLKLGIVISVFGILLTLLFIKFKDKLIKFKFINNISFITYAVLYVIAAFVFYIIPFGMFVISFLRR